MYRELRYIPDPSRRKAMAATCSPTHAASASSAASSARSPPLLEAPCAQDDDRRLRQNAAAGQRTRGQERAEAAATSHSSRRVRPQGVVPGHPSGRHDAGRADGGEQDACGRVAGAEPPPPQRGRARPRGRPPRRRSPRTSSPGSPRNGIARPPATAQRLGMERRETPTRAPQRSEGTAAPAAPGGCSPRRTEG